jgi:hypothetical protein
MNKEKLRQRFLRDSLPVRLGGLAATLARVSSSAREAENPVIVSGLMDEARYLIEWTAAEAEPEVAAELVQTQRLLTLWLRAWNAAHADRHQRVLLAAQAKEWSDKTLQYSGLLNEDNPKRIL